MARIKTIASYILLGAALGVPLALGACASSVGSGALTAVSSLDMLDYFQRDTNLREKDTEAADFLADRGRGFIKPGDSIRALPLLDVDEPRLSTRFGREIPEQIGQRLTDLGYNVDLTGVSTDVDPSYQATPEYRMKTPEFILTGSYTRASSVIDVRLYIRDASTGHERAAFSFTLPRHGNVRKDSDPKATIERMDEDNLSASPSPDSSPVPPRDLQPVISSTLNK